MFFMRTPEDLTGRDGDLILVEFCEEHPPLINQVVLLTHIGSRKCEGEFFYCVYTFFLAGWHVLQDEELLQEKGE